MFTTQQKEILARMPSLRSQFICQNIHKKFLETEKKYGADSIEAREAKHKYQYACDKLDGYQ